MPDLNEHLRQARRNHDYADSLDGTGFSEWLVVAWFYCALHYVDAFLAASLPDSEAHPKSHRTRGFALAHADPDDQYGDLWESYRKLDTLSRVARYDCQPDAPEFTGDLFERLYRVHFLPLVETLEKVLS